jgi:hypothetical protein
MKNIQKVTSDRLAIVGNLTLIDASLKRDEQLITVLFDDISN